MIREVIRLHSCSCSCCKGRGAVCMAAFDWVERDDNHAMRHAQEDMLKYFDRLPEPIKEALMEADVNVCSWCAEIWVDQYGIADTTRLIRSVKYTDDTHAYATI
jgi:hypothetical protein